jgi:putative oxidoreductase
MCDRIWLTDYMNRQLTRDLALAVARVVVGAIFIAHGWQKLVTFGLDATSQGFAGMGVPLPTVSAALAGVIELGGGLALALGAFTTVAGIATALDMLGAFVLVHLGNGVFVTENGWELVAALGAASIALAAVGAGRFSVDGVLARRSKKGASAPSVERERVSA